MVLLSARGRTVPEIAAIFALHPASIRFWLRRFDRDGPEGLHDAPRRGRPRLVDADVDCTLTTLITSDSAAVVGGAEATFWTVAMLTLALITRLGHYLRPSTVRGRLHRLGLRWRRPRLSMPQKVDPQKAQKQWVIVEAVITAGSDTAVLYADASWVQTLPVVNPKSWLWHK